jgi:hypothetical protein
MIEGDVNRSVLGTIHTGRLYYRNRLPKPYLRIFGAARFPVGEIVGSQHAT